MRRGTPTFRRLAIVLTAAIFALGFAAPVPAPAALAGGNQLWTASYHGQQSGEAGATAEAVSPGGRTVFVTGFTGYTAQDGSTGWATLAYNTPTGARRWLRTYRGSDTSPTAVDGATSIAVSPDGSTVFAGGFVTNSGGVSAIETIAYSAATGVTLWARQYTADGADSPVTMAVTADGSAVYVMTQDYRTLAYRAATGRFLWASPAKGLGSNSFAAAGALAPDGSRLYVTGVSLGKNGEEYQSVAYDAATGAMVWVRRLAGPAAGISYNATSVAVSRDGSTVLVAGYVNGGAGSNPIVGYDSTTGATVWTKQWLPTSSGYCCETVSLGVSPNGSTMFVTGVGGGGFNPGFYETQAREVSTGALVWSRTCCTSEGSGSLIAASPDGSAVFTSGYLANNEGTDAYATVSYGAATGTEHWEATYSGPHPTRGAVDPAAIAVSPDGSKVFVTGQAPQGSNQDSFTTVAYGT